MIYASAPTVQWLVITLVLLIESGDMALRRYAVAKGQTYFTMGAVTIPICIAGLMISRYSSDTLATVLIAVALLLRLATFLIR